MSGFIRKEKKKKRMKYAMLQKKILDDQMKGFDWYIDEQGDEYILSNAFALWIVPKEHFHLNKEKFIPKDVFWKTLDNARERANVTRDEFTKMSKILSEGKKKNMLKLEGESHSVLADERFFKYFEKDARYFSSEGYNPILAYENNTVVGLVLPIRSES